MVPIKQGINTIQNIEINYPFRELWKSLLIALGLKIKQSRILTTIAEQISVCEAKTGIESRSIKAPAELRKKLCCLGGGEVSPTLFFKIGAGQEITEVVVDLSAYLCFDADPRERSSKDLR